MCLDRAAYHHMKVFMQAFVSEGYMHLMKILDLLRQLADSKHQKSGLTHALLITKNTTETAPWSTLFVVQTWTLQTKLKHFMPLLFFLTDTCHLLTFLCLQMKDIIAFYVHEFCSNIVRMSNVLKRPENDMFLLIEIPNKLK